MKRDMALIREILLHAEQSPQGFCGENPDIAGYTDEQIDYHVFLMDQAGLVKAFDNTTIGSSSPSAILLHLTWAGYDFIANSREPSRWEAAKTMIEKNGKEVSFEIWVAGRWF